LFSSILAQSPAHLLSMRSGGQKTHLGAARSAGACFSGFVSSGIQSAKPEKFVAFEKAACTVESLALAGKPHVGQDGILLPIGNRPLRVFIPFHGPERPPARSKDSLFPFTRSATRPPVRASKKLRESCTLARLSSPFMGRRPMRTGIATQGSHGCVHSDFTAPPGPLLTSVFYVPQGHGERSSPPQTRICLCTFSNNS